eukprot:2955_1
MGASESSITATASLQLTIIATERTESQFHIDFKTLNDGDTSLLCHGFIRCNTSISLDAVTPLIIKYFGMNHKPRQQQCSINVSDVTLYKNHFHSLLFLNVLDVDNQQCSKYNFRITLKQNKCTNWYYQHNGYGLQIGLFGLNASHLSIDKFWESWKDFDTVQDAVYTTRNIGGVYNLNGCAFRDRFKSTLDSDAYTTCHLHFSAITETREAHKAQKYHYKCLYYDGNASGARDKCLYDKHRFNNKYCLRFKEEDSISIRVNNEDQNGSKTLSFYKNTSKICKDVALDIDYVYYPYFVSRGCDCPRDNTNGGFVFEASVV